MKNTWGAPLGEHQLDFLPKLKLQNWCQTFHCNMIFEDRWGFEMPAFNGTSITKNKWHLEIEPKLHDKGKRLKQQRLPDTSKKITADGFNGKMTAYAAKNWDWINFKYLHFFSRTKQGLKSFTHSSHWIVWINYVVSQCKAYDANRKSNAYSLWHSIYKSRNGISAVGHLN